MPAAPGRWSLVLSSTTTECAAWQTSIACAPVLDPRGTVTRPEERAPTQRHARVASANQGQQRHVDRECLSFETWPRTASPA